MGKIADALERHQKEKKEKSIKVKGSYTAKPKMLAPEKREVSVAKEFCTLHECSPKVVALSAPDSVDAENFRILRANILFAKNPERPRTIMVTSPLPGDGKTFVAANLAVSLAMGMDNYVLLVDSDLRFPRLHNMLGYANSGGLHELLTGKRQLRELIVRTQIEKLSILPAGSVPPNPAELLSSTVMEKFLKEVKERYEDRFVIIDSTPARGIAETKVLATYVDGIILVVMAEQTPRKAIQDAIHILGREKILGLVFNGYSQAHRNYHKYYTKYYKAK
jgi:exopolysaccharide/PEP-CTERM locus tyrosine autokinase